MAGLFPVVKLYYSKEHYSMTLDSLIELFTSAGCNQVLAKRLAANDNSKNQVFVGGSFEVLNQIPFGTISLDSSKKAGSKKDRLKAPLRFAWLTEDGHEHLAPNATLILYPKYPEVRLSGFLQGSDLSRPKLQTIRRQDLGGATDGNRQHRDTGLDRRHKDSGLETRHFTTPAAGPLRERH